MWRTAVVHLRHVHVTRNVVLFLTLGTKQSTQKHPWQKEKHGGNRQQGNKLAYTYIYIEFLIMFIVIIVVIAIIVIYCYYYYLSSHFLFMYLFAYLFSYLLI